MKQLNLIRIAENEHGTFGAWVDSHVPFAVSLEPDNNEIKRIPAGTYTCKRDYYHHGDYETFEVTGVPERTRILIHKGNAETNTAGCLLIGEMYEPLNGKPAILQSGKAFDELMRKLDGLDEFELVISEAFV